MYFKTLTVTQLNDYIIGSFAHDPILRNVRVAAEVSNFVRTASGHAYFVLKDENAVLNCVCFDSQLQMLDFLPSDGLKIEATGYVSLYSRSGKMQMYVNEIEKIGTGELFRRFEQTKKRLDELGYFAPERKRNIPRMPRTIGVVTSSTGAVIHDICKVAWRRNPGQRILLYPCKVQGDGAAQEIARGIIEMNNLRDKENIDVIIAARGGGSLEELWAFNEIEVADAVYNSGIPIVSAVGHETDFSICDFTADVRASTPSVAAELCTADISSYMQSISALYGRIYECARKSVDDKLIKCNMLMNSRAFAHPKARLEQERERLFFALEKLKLAIKANFDRLENSLNTAEIRINSSSPLTALNRGFALVSSPEGELLMNAKELLNRKPEILELRFSDHTVQIDIAGIRIKDQTHSEQ